MADFSHKWRPSYKCLYVIPEVHGNLNSLEIILGRILPLRKTKNQKDILVMMGDYIDNGKDSAQVLDKLIEIQKEFPDRIFFLKGNHEQMFLDAFDSEINFDLWFKSGGIKTIESYISKLHNKISLNISRARLKEVIGIEHLNFLNNLKSHIRIDDYVFFHGGVNIKLGYENTSNSTFINDTSTSKSFKEKDIDIIDDCAYVGCHNYKSKLPFINQKYFMLGGSAPKRLFVFDFNSMSASSVKMGKNNLYKFKLNV